MSGCCGGPNPSGRSGDFLLVEDPPGCMHVWVQSKLFPVCRCRRLRTQERAIAVTHQSLKDQPTSIQESFRMSLPCEWLSRQFWRQKRTPACSSLPTSCIGPLYGVHFLRIPECHDRDDYFAFGPPYDYTGLLFPTRLASGRLHFGPRADGGPTTVQWVSVAAAKRGLAVLSSPLQGMTVKLPVARYPLEERDVGGARISNNDSILGQWLRNRELEVVLGGHRQPHPTAKWLGRRIGMFRCVSVSKLGGILWTRDVPKITLIGSRCAVM